MKSFILSLAILSIYQVSAYIKCNFKFSQSYPVFGPYSCQFESNETQGAAVRKKIGWPCKGQPIFEISVTTLIIIFQCFDFFLKNIFTKISLGYDLNSSKTWWRIILARNLYVPSVRSKKIWLKVIFIFDFGRILKNLTYSFQKSAFFHSVFFWKKISQQCRLTADFADCRTLRQLFS